MTRDLREYRLLTITQIRAIDVRFRQLERQTTKLNARIAREQQATEQVRTKLETERGLLNVALHELAIAFEAKDPAAFVRRWVNEHYERTEAWK